MHDKKPQCISYLVSGLLITFLVVFILVIDIINTNARDESITITSHEMNKSEVMSDQSILSKETQRNISYIDKGSQYSLEFDLRLAGTVLVGKEYTYALIAEETTGRQNLYSVGESIKGAEILKIDKDSVVIEKEGKIWVLKVTGVTNSENSLSETHTENGPLFTGVSEELPFFEPVFSETGPPVDENIHVEELPPFEPITNSTGPPVDPEGLYEGLQEFIPFENDSGPPGV